MWTGDDDPAGRAEHRVGRSWTPDGEQDPGEEPTDPEMEIEDAPPEEVGYGYGV